MPLIVLGLLSATTGLAETDEKGLYLFRVPVTLGGQDVLPLGPRLALGLDVPNPPYVAGRLETAGITVRGVDDDIVALELESPTVLIGDPAPRHSMSSFVVDFEEPPVAELASTLREAHGSSVPIASLLEFVDEAIQSKSYRRDFDIASRVARTREGDCTEHAVLLAALARATGLPARVVIGVLLVETATEVFAFGHAWAEIHDRNGWQLADATRPERQLPGARAHYIPLMELDNEGPGYALSVLNFAALQPRRIADVRPAQP